MSLKYVHENINNILITLCEMVEYIFAATVYESSYECMMKLCEMKKLVCDMQEA